MPYLARILRLPQGDERSVMEPMSQMTGGARDFDFLYGEWMVQGRRRLAPLSGVDEWETIEAVLKCWPLLNGLGNVGELVADDGEPLYAFLSFFDPRTSLWTIYSVSLAEGIALPPARGQFVGGVGEFSCEYGKDGLDGRPVLARDWWNRTETGRPRWERSLSGDGGQSWERYWSMEFERVYWPLEAGPVPEWLPGPALAL